MKILSKGGLNDSVALKLDDPEDVWHLYHVICPGDHLESKTFRNVILLSKEGATNVGKRRIATKITIDVEKAAIDLKSLELRASGKNIKENSYVKKGEFHTHQIKCDSVVVLYKSNWDRASVERIKIACDLSRRTNAILLLIQHDSGQLCSITSSLTIVKQTFKARYSLKTNESASLRKTQIEKFYTNIYNTVFSNVDMYAISAFLVAGPVFYKDKLLGHILKLAEERGNQDIIKNKHKFIKVHSSSGRSTAIREIMSSSDLDKTIEAVRFNSDKIIMDELNSIMALSPNRAFYGFKHVKYVVDRGAVDTLIICDSVYMSVDLEERVKFDQLVELARLKRAKIHILSSMHEPGERLCLLGGVAVIASYVMPEVDEIMNDGDEKLYAQIDRLMAQLNQM